MQTLEEMKAKHAAELENLEREHALAALAPVPPLQVQLTSATLGEWLIYERPTLWGALDLMRQFEPIPFYEFKKSFTRFVPAPLNVGRDAGEERSGPYVAKIKVNQGEGFGPAVEFCFFVMLGETICEVHCNLRDKWRDQFGQYRAPFHAHSGGRSRMLAGNRYIAGDFRANPKLSGMMDKTTHWGSGSQEAASFSYAISADSVEGDGPCEWRDAGLRLENIAEAMHGPRPRYRFEFNQVAMSARFVRLEDGATSPEIKGDEAWRLYNLDRYHQSAELNAAADALPALLWSAPE